MAQKVNHCFLISASLTAFTLVYKRTPELHLVKIYFSTPTFDRITKDEKANFEDKLAVIGGTMGLLTGFSLISGVEIIYFLLKIAAIIIRKKPKEKGQD